MNLKKNQNQMINTRIWYSKTKWSLLEIFKMIEFLMLPRKNQVLIIIYWEWEAVGPELQIQEENNQMFQTSKLLILLDNKMNELF